MNILNPFLYIKDKFIALFKNEFKYKILDI